MNTVGEFEEFLIALEQYTMQLNTFMTEQSITIPTDFLARIEFLPDGTATTDQQVWLKSWAEVAQLQVAQGKIKLHEVEAYDPDTDRVPNSFIKEIYIKNRTVN